MPKNHGSLARLAVAVALALWCFRGKTVAATEPHYHVDVWATDKGLHSSIVTSVLQARDGYLWVGTLGGLTRFDGTQFQVFDENTTPGLNSSQIVHLFQDSRSNLWVGTETAGAALISGGAVTSLAEVGAGSQEGRLVATCEDSSGAVWLCTADGRLYRYRDGKLDVWRIPVTSANKVVGLAPDASGLLWLGMERVLVAFRPTVMAGSTGAFPVDQVANVGHLDMVLPGLHGDQWRLADGRVQRLTEAGVLQDLGPYPWTNAVVVRAACEDREGNLVIGTYGSGVYWFDGPGHATCISTNQGLSNSHVLALCLDREGSLWVGTDSGGLNRVKRQDFEALPVSRGLTVRSVCEDAEGGLWFSSEGDGLDYWKDNVLRHAGTEDVNQQTGANRRMDGSYYVRAVLAGRDRRIWVSSAGPGLFRLESDGVFHRVWGSAGGSPAIPALHEDLGGRLWAGMQGGLGCFDGTRWTLYAKDTPLAQDNVRAVADDRKGNVWIGTERDGLKRLKDGQITSVQPPEGPPIRNVSALYVDERDVLWIGTSGRGLARLEDGRWKRFTTREGLASDHISYLLQDGEGYLWLGSNAGLMRVRREALDGWEEGSGGPLPCRSYGSEDGLPTAESAGDTQPAACRGGDGRLYFPTLNGLVSVDPAKLQVNTNPPPVVIESVLVEGVEQGTNGIGTPPPASVTVPAGRERLEIHYSSLNLAAPEKARFKYRLEGHEKGWTEVESRSAIYTRLPHGQYAFRVQACNEDGVWNETGASLAVVVLPFFWQTGWFLTLTALGLLGVVAAAVHSISTQRLQRQLAGMREQQALEDERARIARDIHDQVGASLTQVSLLGELIEGDKHLPGEVEAHARQISQTARETARALDEIVWTVNPSNDTLEGLVNYVSKCAQDYLTVAGIRYRLDAPAQLPATPVTPEVRHNVFLAARESVNNVVKHARATEAWIRLRQEPGRLVLEVQDNGRGPAGATAAAAGSRNGLRNMRKRMEDVGGSFAIGAAPEGGTLVRLVVPLAKG